MINHHQNSFYSFSVNTYKEIYVSVSTPSVLETWGGLLKRIEIPEIEDYKIGISVVSDPRAREDLLIFLSFYTLNMYLHLEAINVLIKY